MLGPRPRQIQGAINQGVSAPCRVGQVHRDLGVLDAPGGAGVLTLHADRIHALLQVAGFVNDENRAGVAEGVDDIVAQIIAHVLGVPFRPRQQVLQAIGSGLAAMLGDRPAILAIQARDHPEHQLAGMTQAVRSGRNAARSGRSPPKTPSTTDQGLRYEPRRPRHIQMSSQTPNNAPVTAPTSADTPERRNPELRLQY